MAKADAIANFEFSDYMDAEELDTVKTVLAYILMDSTDMDRDEIYALVFQDGRKIIWH